MSKISSHIELREERLLEFAKSVELVASKLLEGEHSSLRPGGGVEYHSTRPYQEGDEPRAIDWKRLAASDKVYSRVFRREKKAGWSIVVDGSKSMDYGGKSDWARLWAGCLIFLAKAWGDQWLLWPSLEGDLYEAFAALSDKSLPEDILGTEGEFRRDHRLILLTDSFIEEDRLFPWIERAESEAFQFCLLQILDLKERSFPFTDLTEFQDLESSRKISLQPSSIKSEYHRVFDEWTDALRSRVPEPHLFFQFVSQVEPIENQLMRFFESL